MNLLADEVGGDEYLVNGNMMPITAAHMKNGRDAS